MDQVDCVVIGAGVVGLAVARALALAGREVLIAEEALDIGTGTSSRNSEVIHAGLYYPTGSLKAALCLRGRELLYDYCASRGVGHSRCGKYIVATDAAQQGALDAILAQAHANGCTEVRRMDAAEAMANEPALRCVAALDSPMTGIVDSHGLMLALLGDAERAGASLALDSPVLGGAVVPEGVALAVGHDGYRILARTVVNCAGLWAPRLAARIEGLPPASVPTAHFAKGSYFSLAGRAPFGRLVYPVPEPGGLGVHLTLDLGGQARFGPDVQWLADGQSPGSLDYRVDPVRGESFYAAIRRYWPALPDAALSPAYSGVRPKVSAAFEPAADFVLSLPQDHGVAGYAGLYGIESPGLTASLAIAERVAARLALAQA